MIGLGRRYKFKRSISSPAANAVMMQVVSNASKVLVILEIKITQVFSTTSAQLEVILARYSAAATGLTAAVAGDIVAQDPGDAASGVQLGTALTGYSTNVTTGTQSAVLEDEGFNILNGYRHLPIPEERNVVPGGGIVVLKCGATAWPAGAYLVEITFAEIG